MPPTIIPPRLRTGDTVGIIAPSSCVLKEDVEPGIGYLESCGFQVVLGHSLYSKHRYLAGTDQDRANDINRMFENPKIQALLCARGGYGSIRILDKINYGMIPYNPKILIGFSDSTALQLAMYAKAKLVSYSGLLLTKDITDENINSDTLGSLTNVICHNKFKPAQNFTVIKPGIAKGPVIAGCLTIICSLLGTPFCPKMEDAILVIEDVNEEPYRIDRLLAQLRLSGTLSRIGGLVLGTFEDCGNHQNDNHLLEIFEELQEVVQGPIISGFPYGHGTDRVILPIGIKGKIIAKSNQGSFSIEQPMVL